jgi:hypothetical protein
MRGQVRRDQEESEFQWIRVYSVKYSKNIVDDLGYKGIDWKYEKEIRIQAYLGLHFIGKESVKEFYFGLRTPTKQMQSLLALLLNESYGINIYKAKLKRDQFKIEFDPIATRK